MKTFLSIVDGISLWSGKTFAWLLIPATLVVCYGVIRRYVFNAPTIFELDLTIYLSMSTYLLGGAYAQLRNAHVRVDVFYLHFSPRMKAIVELASVPIFAIGLGTLLWAGLDWTIQAIVNGETAGTIWDPPIWPMRSLIAIGSFLLLIQGSATFIRSLAIVRGKSESWLQPAVEEQHEY